jgi:ParB-like chromosome segregation protein Spo0J
VWEDVDDVQAARDAAVANLQREGLTPYEEARAFQRLVDLGMQKKEICRLAGVVFHTLDDRLKLLTLPESVGRRVGLDGFTMGHTKTLLPLAGHPDLVDVVMKAFDNAAKNDGLPDARDAPELVLEALSDSQKVAQASEFLNYQEREAIPNLDKKLRELPHLEVQGSYGGKKLLITDRKALEAKATEWKADLKAKQAKEASKTQQATIDTKEQEKAEKVKRQRDAAATRHAGRLRDAAFAAKLKTSKVRGLAAWAAVVEWIDSDGLTSYSKTDDEDSLDFLIALGTAVGAKADDVRTTFEPYLGPDGTQTLRASAPPAWFTKLHNDAQLAILVGIMGRSPLDRTYNPQHKQLVEALTGESPAAWEKAGVAKARELERAPATVQKPKKGPPPAVAPAPKGKKSAQELLKAQKQAKKAAQATSDKAKTKAKGKAAAAQAALPVAPTPAMAAVSGE